MVPEYRLSVSIVLSRRRQPCILFDMSRKRTKRHFCYIHRENRSTGRCFSCNRRICDVCAAKIDGRVYCPECSPGKRTEPVPASSSLVQQSSRPPLAVPVPLFLLAAVTLVLCGFVFGMWNLRRAWSLESQNRELKEKRIELLGQIKERNAEILSLRGRIDSATQAFHNQAEPEKNTRSVGSAPAEPSWVDGLPLTFNNGSLQNRLICLTFDGNDGANAAGEILDTLKSRSVKATMFLTGRFIFRNADVVNRIVSEGHEVGSHTFTHPHLTTYAVDRTQTLLPSITEDFLRRELIKTDSAFRQVTGGALAHLWRAPYGEYNRAVCLWARRAGFIHVGWRQGRTWKLGLDSNDWTADEETPGYHSPQEVFDKIVGLAQSGGPGVNGGIILMHLNTVRPQRNKQVHSILGKLIDTLQSYGYRFVTVTEMMKESGVDATLLNRN